MVAHLPFQHRWAAGRLFEDERTRSAGGRTGEDGANLNRENVRAAAAIWGGADSLWRTRFGKQNGGRSVIDATICRARVFRGVILCHPF
jgi:hypothetical protein